MSFAIVNYTGNGSTTTYSITFPYITSSHVVVKVDNVVKTAGTDYTFPTSSTIQFTTAPANGTSISISRSSSRSTRLVDYQDGATITEAILDQDSNQLFYISQEAFDTADNAMLLDTDNKYNANSKIIKNVLNPVNAQDAVTKNYLENTWLSTADKATLTNLNSNIASVNAVNSALANVNTVASDLNEAVSEIDTVATNIANVNTVGTNIANVNTVAGISGNVTTVAGNNANVTTVAGANANITTVAGQISPTNNIATVAGANANISTVATNVANVNTVGGAIANVNTVAGANANITTVAGANANISTVATNVANVNLVGGSIANVNTVATNIANVNTVAGNNANINTVAGANANINTVAGISADITTVATNAGNISTVATDIAKVITAANDLNEATSEIEVVANAIANVDTVGTNIANVNLVGGSIANVNAVSSNLAGVNSFAERYRISSTAPSTSLDSGDLWFDTTANKLKVYGAAGFELAGSSVNGTTNRFIYTATSGQTTFTGADDNTNLLAYDAGYIDVYLNGIRLNPADYTASSGSSIVLASGATAGDILYVVAFGTFSLANINANDISTGTLNTARLPTVPTTKGGTGLTTIGTAGQALVVNSGATGLEFGTIQASEITTGGNIFSNYNVISSNCTTTTSSTKNAFLHGDINVSGSAIWDITGSGSLRIIDLPTIPNIFSISRGGTGISTVAGNNNKFLKVNSAGTSFEFQNSDFVKLITTNVTSNTALVSLDGYFTSEFTNYVIYFSNVYPDTANASFRFRVRRNGTEYTLANYNWSTGGVYRNFVNTASGFTEASLCGDTSFQLNVNDLSNSNNHVMNGLLNIYNPLVTGKYRSFNWQTGNVQNNNDYIYNSHGYGVMTGIQNVALTGITFFMTSGNINTAKFTLYGFKH